MALNPPNRAQYVGPLENGMPQAGSPEDMQFIKDSLARANERQTARAKKVPVKFRKVSGEEITMPTSKLVRAQSSNKHWYDYSVDAKTGIALPLTAAHVDDCPTCKDEK